MSDDPHKDRMHGGRNAYETLTTTGQHQGDAAQSNSEGTSVRAPEPPSSEPVEARPVTGLYQHAHHSEEGHHRVRAVSGEEVPDLPSGYSELGRYTSQLQLAAPLEELTRKPHFVVLENTRTGAHRFDEEHRLEAGQDWTEGGRFDQVTLFHEQEDARTYAGDLGDRDPAEERVPSGRDAA